MTEVKDKVQNILVAAKYPAKTPVQTLAITPRLYNHSVSGLNTNWNLFNALQDAKAVYARKPLWSNDIGGGPNYRNIHELYIRTDLKLGGDGLNYRNPNNPTQLSTSQLNHIESGGKLAGVNPNDPNGYSIHFIEGQGMPEVANPNNLILVTNAERDLIAAGQSETTYRTQNYDQIVRTSLRKSNGNIFFTTLWTVAWMGFLMGFFAELIYTLFKIVIHRKKINKKQIKTLSLNVLFSGLLMSFYAMVIWFVNFMILSLMLRVLDNVMNDIQIIFLSSFINLILLLVVQWIISIQAENSEEKEIMTADGHKRILYLLLSMVVVTISFNLLGFIGGIIGIALLRILLGNKKYLLLD